MHIPDGYISPQTAGGLWAMMVPVWYAAGYKVKRTLSSRQAPLVAVGAAFAFVIMMFNIPLPGGTTGHAVGGTIIAIVIGPWAAVIAISVALAIQALFFGDGGILALGANCFNIGFILPVTGYYTYRLLSRGSSDNSVRRWLSAGIGAYIGLNVAALSTALIFGLQGELFNAADGSALYSPYGLSTAIPAMMIPHMAVAGLAEAVMTSLIVVFLQRTDASLLHNYDQTRAAVKGSLQLKPLLIGVALLLFFVPVGLLATGSAWGEWGSQEISEDIGYVPEGMDRYSGWWTGVLPDYAFPEAEAAPSVESAAEAAPSVDEPVGAISLKGVREAAPAYLISGVLGLVLVGLIAFLSVRFLTRRSGKEGGNPGR